MSYGLKYQLLFNDEIKGSLSYNSYVIDIYKKSYSGSVIDLTATAKPISISYKKQALMAGIMASEATVELYGTTLGMFDEFKTAAPLSYYVKVTKNGGDFWYGVITTDSYTQGHASAPYSCRLRFNDGLGELQWHRYENSGALMAQLEQTVQIINNTFSFLPYNLKLTEAINVREDTMSDARGLLEQLYLDDLAFTEQGDDGLMHGINCNKLLSTLMTSLTCRIYQCEGTWFIERVVERTSGSTLFTFDYTLTGAFETSNTFSGISRGLSNILLSIDNNSMPRIVDSSEDSVTIKNPSISYGLDTTSFNNLELVPNAFFETNPLDIWVGNMPALWDRTSKLIAAGGTQGLEVINPWSNDARYQTGFSFGQNSANAMSSILGSGYNALLAAKGPGSNVNSQMWIHAVRRTGDSITLPSVYMNGNSGSLQVNFQYYTKIRVYPNYATRVTPTQLNTDMNQILHSPTFNFYPFIHLALRSSGGGWNYLTGNSLSTAGWSVSTQAWCVIDDVWFQKCNDAGYFVGSSGLTKMTPAALMAQLGRCNGNPTFYFDLPVIYNVQQNIPFTGTTITSPDVVEFDLQVYPAYFDAKEGFVNRGKCTFNLHDFAVIASDIQYKDNYTTAVALKTFYSAPDNDTRWSELTIKAIYGDQVSPSYPGAFRLSNGNETTTWRHRGLSDTGQRFADLVCKDILPIVDTYRNSMTAKIIGDTQFLNNIEDTDGVIYLQTGCTFDLKARMATINMEQIDAYTTSIIIANLGGGNTNIATTNTTQTTTVPIVSIMSVPSTTISAKIATVSSVTTISSYPG